VNVVCFDKTGTLTENRMTVAEIRCAGRRREVSAPTGNGAEDPRQDVDASLRRLLEIACLCSEVEVGHSNGRMVIGESATEAALTECAARHGIEFESLRRQYHLVQAQERTEGDRMMITAHAGNPRGDAAVLIAVKGSPEEVLARCTHELGPD